MKIKIYSTTFSLFSVGNPNWRSTFPSFREDRALSLTKKATFSYPSTSVNFSTYNSLKDVAWDSIWDTNKLTMEPINDLTRWVIALWKQR